MKATVNRRSVWALAGAAIVGAGILLVLPAHGQTDMGELAIILQTLAQMNSIMSQSEAPALTIAATSSQQQQLYQQQVVYPPSSIVNALAQATGMVSEIGSIQSVIGTPVNSATLPQSMTLENQLRGGNTGSMGSISGSYGAVYGALPASTSMTPHSRMAVDMSDAQAQASLKKAIELDAIANQEQLLAKQLMQGLTTSSPGSASLIAAQAAAWNLQATAYTQGGFAQLLRLDSANTAYDGQQTKKLIASQTPNQSGAM